MKKKLIFIFFGVLIFVISNFSLAENIPYCAKPPFIQANLPSNVMLVLDYSGSMSFPAYYSANYKIRENSPSYEEPYYDNSKTYYGYFIPGENYKKVNGVWEITNDTNSCDIECYKDYNNEGYYITMCSASGVCSGNELNFAYMTRMDILRWILTGGSTQKISECVYSKNGCSIYDNWRNCENNYVCSWSWWYGECQNGGWYSCSDYTNKYNCNNNPVCTYIEESVVNTLENNALIKMEDVSSYNPADKKVEGILQRIEKQEQKPRIGAVFFSSDIKDRVGLSDNYTELISSINTKSPGGGTCTACAVDEMKELFSQKSDTIEKYGDVNPYEFNIDDKEVKVPCAKNFILLMSDGEWNIPDTTTKSDPIKPIDDMWKGGTADLVKDLPGKQQVETYTVSMFANPDDKGTNALKWMAVYGNYIDSRDHSVVYPCNQSSYPNTSLTVAENLENNCSNGEVKQNKDGTGPYGFYEGDNPEELKKAITEAFNEILKQASSGTAASVLSEKERVNMGIIQAAFYPEKVFVDSSNTYKVKWIGSLYNWWFYGAYTFNGYVSNIREDTIDNKYLDICSNGKPGGDYIIEYDFENGELKIKGYKSSCGGVEYSDTPAVVYNGLDSAHYVWEAGKKLAEEKPSDRTIYTYVGDTLPKDSEKPLEQLQSLNNSDTYKPSTLFGDSNKDGVIVIDNSSDKVITFDNLKSYIYGNDISGYRERVIDDKGDTWKLGDIIYSTPKVVNYDDYSVAFVGANDGMLHAFLVGKYRYDGLGPYQLGRLTNSVFDSGTGSLGKELWAFIPKNALPYLRFLADPDYCHMYFVDLTPYIIEMKDKWGNVEKRILIGGMRLGGAVGCDNSTYCINPPEDTCPDPENYSSTHDPSTSPEGCLGLSSYFALDITDPTQPKFLWEFSNPDLGFSYSGPAFIKKKDDKGNWHYYVMFSSGPTDYNGDVGQHFYVFVLSLNSTLKNSDGSYNPAFFTVTDVYKKDLSNIVDSDYAFGGRLFTQGVDFNGDGSTDILFEGVVEYKNGEWKGNVIGIRPSDLNPANWDYFKLFTTPIGPVVASINYEKCFKKHFIYFGSGRYFYKDDTPDGEVEKLYGLEIDDCLNNDCSFTPSGLYTSDDSCSHIGENGYGWYQNLLEEGDGYNKERTITGATTTDENVVFFTTTQPTSDVCGFGGRSRLWGMNCATGESLTNQQCKNYQTGKIIGTLLLQTSVGEISKFDINITNVTKPEGNITPFTQENGKATEWKSGVAPENKSNWTPPPTKKPAKILYEIEN
ncbi:VWA domain-containing protein [Hippea alviniae]|uniref:VWA domain-containing protein n=1 Tax=Hippea alviniae TaxID=1279027 RepID=UPI0003B78039|nr:VWA domain-containing protein [Hippea alviniae]